MNDPFRHLNLEQVEKAEREADPWLFKLAEFIVFARAPVSWMRGLLRRRAIGYRGEW